MTKKLNKNDFLFLPCILFIQEEEGTPKKEIYSQTVIRISEIQTIYKDRKGNTVIIINDYYMIIPIIYEDFLIDNFSDL